MGHDITAIKDIYEYSEFWESENSNFSDESVSKFRKKNEVAYLRRSMSSTSIRTFYLYLNCAEYYAGVSGNGEKVWISADRIRNALDKFEENKNLFESPELQEDYNDYTTFLFTCYKFCTDKKQKGVVISFG